jgi:hypothetical protein
MNKEGMHFITMYINSNVSCDARATLLRVILFLDEVGERFLGM